MNCPYRASIKTQRNLPRPILVDLDAYVLHGAAPSDLLRPILEHDLLGCIAALDKDETLTTVVRPLVRYLYSAAPQDCHGSRTLVRLWCARGGLERVEPNAALSRSIRRDEINAAFDLIASHVSPARRATLTTFRKDF